MRVFFKTFGCRLNQSEASKTGAVLRTAGWETVVSPDAADVICIHSCAVTATAESEGIRFLRRMKRDYPETFCVFSGCAAAEAGEADLILSGDERDRLGEILLEHFGTGSDQDWLGGIRTARAFLKVQDGCDFFCSYCIVPYRRGGPVSRSAETCLSEAKRMIAAGFQELVLTGCNLSLYAGGLPELVRQVSALPGLGRVRLSSIEPGSCEIALSELMREDPRICRFLHLPVQSGSDAVLKAMGRRYGVGELRARLDAILRNVPDIALGADFITGFPGETEADLEQTLALVGDYPWSNLHVFAYSERPGTPAAELPNRLPNTVRKERAGFLAALGEQKRVAFEKRFAFETVECVIEGIDEEGTAHGWTGQYLPCRFKACGFGRKDLVQVYRVKVALGSNLGDRAANIRQATEMLGEKSLVLKSASPIETDPVEVSGGKFLNTAVLLATVLKPDELMREVHRIEALLGRPNAHRPGNARTIDIDLIEYSGGLSWNTAELILPHPRAAEREFVQIPLRALEDI